MQLDDFIAQTLIHIVQGVRNAQAELDKNDAIANPRSDENRSRIGEQGLMWSGNRVAQTVKFDVALTATEGTGTRGGIGVVTGIFALGSSGQSSQQTQAHSRVQFMVPLVLPQQ